MDNETLQAIRMMLDEQKKEILAEVAAVEKRTAEQIAASDQRTAEQIADVKTSTAEQIAASDQRTAEQIADVKASTAEQIAASERRIMIYIENNVEKGIRSLADGHKLLAEKIERIDVRKDLDEMKGSLAVIESAVTRNTSSIIELQKAQG